MINGFYGKYHFLSNFYESGFYMCEKFYASSEHAFQAYKATNEEDHRLIQTQSSPRMAKKYGRLIKVREDWNDIKYDLMIEVVREKFKDGYLKLKLLETDNEILVETNYWHDNIWGDCTCEKCKDIKGKNWLGEILMKIREELK